VVGLDQYLVAKFKDARETNNLTGACGGLFPLAPKSDKTEIGYWRKFYKLDEIIRDQKEISEDEWDKLNCEDIPLTLEDCTWLKDYASEEILALREWWNDEEPDQNNDDYWDYQEWSATLDIFEKAIKLIKDEGAQVYYKYWR